MKVLRLIVSLATGMMLSLSLPAQAWVSHHGMTAADYQAKFNTYSGQGYRLKLVDGYMVGTTIRYAAIWSKESGPAYVTHHGMTAADYQTKFNTYKGQGYLLELVDGSGGATPTYAAIWVKRQVSFPYVTHHGMSAADYQTKFNTYTGDGYRLVWVNAYGVGNQAQFSAIWEKKGGSAYVTHHAMTAADYQAKFTTYTGQGYRLTQVSAYTLGTTDYYAAIWEKISGPSWSARHGMSSLGYQNEFENHLFSGYKLTGISGYTKGGKERFAAIWESTGAISDADRSHIDGKISSYMAQQQVKGASVALIKDGRLIYAKGYGVMNTSTGEAVGPSSLFRLASVSKPITGVAVMKLSETNAGLLGQKVFGSGSILGTPYGNGNYDTWEKEITVQQLLEHTAGGKTWNNKGDDGTSDPMFDQASYSQSQLIGWVLDNRNTGAKPGTAHDYSNFGFSVLGRVIEKKSGQTYENYVRDKVLKPCGITNMYLAGDLESDRRYNEVTYYGGNPYGMKVKRMDAHGGWLGSAIDLGRFIVRVDGFATKPDILSQTSFNKMVEPSTSNSGYGKGWCISGTNYWHNGSLPGTGALIVRTGNGLSWVFLTSGTYNGACDAMMWEVVNGIKTWPAHDLF